MLSELLSIGALPFTYDASKVRTIHTRAEAEAAQDGDILRRWDFVSVVNDDSLRQSFIQPHRHVGDPLADAVVEVLDLRPGQDGLAVLLDALEGEGVDLRLSAFWAEVRREPPAGVSAFVGGLEGKRGRDEVTPSVGTVSRDGAGKEPSLSEGMGVFWRYSAQIFTALMHFSLAGGFSSPNLGAVMNETGYLTSSSKDATYRRLLETTLMVLDVMSDMRVGEGRGWKSAVRVRLLHAQVRRRIAMRKGKLRVYDEAVSGVPINQADLATVLGSFMIAPLWSLRRCGIDLTAHEMASYQAAWRHVGFYLGVDSALLERCYGRSFATAESTFASLAFENFPEQPLPDGSVTPTYKILSAVSGRPPRSSSVGYHLEYSRVLLGTRLADHLALPRGTRRERLAVWTDLASSWTMIQFGRSWRAGWEEERQRLFAQIMELLVVWQLGERRTVFAWREETTWADKLTREEGEDPGIAMGREVGLDVRRRWVRLVGELGVVAGGVLLLAVGLAAGAIKHRLRVFQDPLPEPA